MFQSSLIRNLHEQTIAEIREEYPGANEYEVRLQVAIRESFLDAPRGGRGLRSNQQGATVTRAKAIAAARALLRYGLTVRDIADVLGAHPRVIEALLVS